MDWYALTEVAARILLEAGLVFFLLIIGLSPIATLLVWIVFHTAAWLLMYGGFMIVWKTLRMSQDLTRLQTNMDRICHTVSQKGFLKIALIRGSAARGELSESSDIDILAVPERGLIRKTKAVAFWWKLRAESALRLIPIEARWVDHERFVPYHIAGEVPRFLIRRSEPPPSPEDRFATRGLLISFSGLDGSGKTTIARMLELALRDRGLDSVRFWAHRQAWFKPKVGPDFGLAVIFESLWKRIGQRLADLARYPRVKFLYDLCTLLDYAYVQWRLVLLSRPRRVVICDRYVADVISYLKSWGPVKITVEGLLVGMSREPDVAVFFALPPSVARQRKQENSLDQLERFAREYEALRDIIHFDSVNASPSVDEVYDEVCRVLVERLRLPLGGTDSLVASGGAERVGEPTSTQGLG